MPSLGHSPELRLTAERIAGEWLREHAYCDCAFQQQTITLRILPVVAMFAPEVEAGRAYGLQVMTARMAIYLTEAHDFLIKGLHRPGASARVAKPAWHAGTDGDVN